jgi:hypothetical protein
MALRLAQHSLVPTALLEHQLLQASFAQLEATAQEEHHH